MKCKNLINALNNYFETCNKMDIDKMSCTKSANLLHEAQAVSAHTDVFIFRWLGLKYEPNWIFNIVETFNIWHYYWQLNLKSKVKQFESKITIELCEDEELLNQLDADWDNVSGEGIILSKLIK